MKNRHNFEFSPKTMLVFLTIICILLLSVSAVLKDAVKPLSAVAETVVIPMQDGINSFGVWVGDHAGSFKSMKELKKENAKLNEKVRELTQENETLSTNEKELNNLQKLLKIDKAYSQYKKVGARVISKGSGNWYNTFVINKGSKDGIKVNMNVIADGGLVGIVTVEEVLIRASLLQKETELPEEYPIIAGVIQNRLDKKMKLQFDSTAVYAITKGQYGIARVMYKDLKVDSPYNTYKHKGLPVGPICSPSLEAIDGVLNPQKNDYLYFQMDTVKNDGSNIFSKTYEEHKAASATTEAAAETTTTAAKQKTKKK